MMIRWFLIGATAATGLLGVGAAMAASPVVAERTTYVIGRDTEMRVSGQLPTPCAGQIVEVSLYSRDGAEPSRISAFAGTESVTTTVAADGSFAALLPLPTSLVKPARVFPGATGACLDAPAVDESLGAELAVAVANPEPSGSSYVYVSSEGLASHPSGQDGLSFGQLLGSITAFADFQRCATESTDPERTGGADVVLHLGAPGQPPECSRPGALITFADGAGAEFFVTMTLVPGTTRLLDNFAGQPPGTPPRSINLRTDKSFYRRPTDESVAMYAQGLTTCAGKQVSFGLFVDVHTPASDLVAVTVSDDGTALGAVRLPFVAVPPLYPGVRGTCISSGTVLAADPVYFESPDLKPPAPPSVGSGTQRPEGSGLLDWSVVLLALAALSASATRFLRRPQR